ncbi:MAG: DUF917 family protein, partial [Synergistales bacterium]|nr:DUF917 family protein [Synergistales bacterium]
IVTCSTVTCPHRKDPFISPRARVRSIELLLESGAPRPSGLIPNECGSTGIVNGWIEGAILGIPLVDAPCNGRAHPTPEMGSMGLHLVEGYVSSQSFAGGNPAKGAYIEGILRGAVDTVSNMIRQDACVVGGILAVARNPVSAAFVRENGAPGAVKQAIRIGKAMKGAAGKGPEAVIAAAAEMLSATVIRCGEVEAVDRFTAGGIDTGTAFLGRAMRTRRPGPFMRGLLLLFAAAPVSFLGLLGAIYAVEELSPLFTLSVIGTSLINALFIRIMGNVTARGRALLDELEGLKLYLSVAERERIRRFADVTLPPETPEQFEKLLPWAIALGVEKEWAAHFETALAEARYEPTWYAGTAAWHATGLTSMTSSLSSGLGGAIAADLRQPRQAAHDLLLNTVAVLTKLAQQRAGQPLAVLQQRSQYMQTNQLLVIHRRRNLLRQRLLQPL